jgi:hypothetical protein
MSRASLQYLAMVGPRVDLILPQRVSSPDESLEIGHVGKLVKSGGCFGSLIIAPPVARHVAERYSYSKIFIALAWLAEAIGLPSGLGGIMTTLLMDLPHSRTQEYEGLCSFRFCFPKRTL